MVSDIQFRRHFAACCALLACGALAVACGSFGEAPRDAPPVDPRRSSDTTDPSDASGANEAATESEDAGAGTSVAAAQSGSTCNGAVDCERVVFVTSQTFRGFQVQGMSGADGLCDSLAASSKNARVKGRSYVAWLSDWIASPSIRMTHGTKPYVRPDGKKIADSFAELTSGTTLGVAIAIDEQDKVQQGAVWTGTTASGEGSGPTCEGWWTQEADGAQGDITSSAVKWTARSGPARDARCEDSSARLYCFER
jgi:hypothetical protein